MMDLQLAQWLSWTLKGSVVLSMTLLALRLGYRRLSANVRFSLLLLGISSFVLLPIFEIFSPSLVTFWIPGESQPPVISEIASPALPTLEHLPSIPTVETPSVKWQWRNILLGCWLLGAILSFAGLLRQLSAVWFLKRKAKVGTPQPMGQLAEKIGSALGLKRPVPVFISDEIKIPQAWGPPLPWVGLPKTALGWEEKRCAMVLAHELAHCRRRDALANCWLRLVLALQWFNPIAWYAYRRAGFEQELAADALALVAGLNSSDYSQELVSMARFFKSQPRSRYATVPLLRSGGLRQRIEALLDSKRSGISRWAVVFSTGVASACFMAMVLVGRVAAIPTMASPAEHVPTLVATHGMDEEEPNASLENVAQNYSGADGSDEPALTVKPSERSSWVDETDATTKEMEIKEKSAISAPETEIRSGEKGVDPVVGIWTWLFSDKPSESGRVEAKDHPIDLLVTLPSKKAFRKSQSKPGDKPKNGFLAPYQPDHWFPDSLNIGKRLRDNIANFGRNRNEKKDNKTVKVKRRVRIKT